MSKESFFYGVISDNEVNKAEERMKEVIDNTPNNLHEESIKNFKNYTPTLINKIKALIYLTLLKKYRCKLSDESIKLLQNFILQ